MIKEDSYKPEIYFNTLDGTLLIGQAALEMELECGSHPTDILPLATLLLQKERVIGPKEFKPVPYIGWDQSLDLDIIRWLHGVVSEHDPTKSVSEEVMTRAGYMGLIPRIHYFKSKPKSLVGVYVEAGLEGVRTRNLIDDWTIKDFVSHIQVLAAQLKHKPGYDDLVEASRVSASNPHPTQIIRKFKAGLSQLFELAGYPDVKSWSEDDYIDWGVKFMFANNGKIPTSRDMATLSSRYRGPHYSSVYDNVGPLSDYQKRVQEEYEIERDYRLGIVERTIEHIQKEIEEDAYPISLFERDESDKEKIAIHARYRLLQYLVPGLEEKYIRQNAIIKRQDWFVRAVQRANPALTVGQIETAASMLNVFDDIWPMDDYMEYLKVS